MKKKSIVIILFIIITLFFIKTEIPMCYNYPPEDVKTFVIYEKGVIDNIKEKIKEQAFYLVKISGKSMNPSIKNGDTCVCIPKTNYSKGDIISFYVPIAEFQAESITHRIVKEVNGTFRTKGDNNPYEDNYIIKKEQIFCQIPERNLFDKFRFAVVESEGKFSVFSMLNFE